ncbi:MAG: N-acetylneuraminate synthase family protein [Microthrixaceae bacterium]
MTDDQWSGWRGRYGPMLIAEIGGNHEGDFDYAKELTRLAIGSGADVVKFQIYTAEQLVNRHESPDRHAHFRRFELQPEQHRELAQMCVDAEVRYMASVWSLEPLVWIDEFLDFYKIGSGDLTAHRLLQEFVGAREADRALHRTVHRAGGARRSRSDPGGRLGV